MTLHLPHAVFAASFAASDSGRANDPEDLVDTDVYSDTDEDEEEGEGGD